MRNESRVTGPWGCRTCLMVILLVSAWQLTPFLGGGEKVRAADIRPTVVIDPGHGGNDKGATGLSATAEKAVALELALLLADEMKHQARVVLTRRDDSEMGAPERSAVANRHRADVFVSLHAGASFSRQPSGYAVYHYLRHSGGTLGRGTESDRSTGPPTSPLDWQTAQLSHQRESESLARSTCDQIARAFPGTPCRLYGAPLHILEGANCPAILVEFGFLTNPSDEKRMTAARHQSALVKAIGEGIRSFLGNSSKQKPPD